MATITTGNSAQAWRPDTNSFAPADISPAALVLQTSTISGHVAGDAQTVRCAFIRDATAGFVPEGDEIPEDNPELDETIVYTGKLAQLARISNEQYGQDQTAPMLANSFGMAIKRAADAAYLAQPAPTDGHNPPAGLLNVPGVINVGEIAGNLDALVDGIAFLEVNESHPTHIIASPLAWGYLRKFKTGETYNSTLLGAGTTDATRMLLGLPVLVSPWIPGDTLLVLDKSVIISAIGDVVVATSEHAAFTADSVVLRATWRFGFNATRPERLAKFTVADPDAA